nr:EamA family transporter [Solihabitans fulvus]
MGTALLVLSSFCFGSSGPLAKAVMDVGLSAPQVASARICLAALMLLLVVGVAAPGRLRPARGEWRLLLGYGLLGVAGVQLCYFVAVSRLPVGIAMLLEYLSPILVVLWVRFVRRTQLPRTMWAGTLLALLGLAMVAQVWQGLRLDAVGLLAGLGAALCSASYFLLGERAVSSGDPVGLVTLGMLVGAVPVVLLSPPWQLLDGAVLGRPTDFGPWHPPVWSMLVTLALLGTVLAYLTGITALRHLPSSVASVLSLIEPVVAAGAAWVLLGEALSPAQLAGGAVLLVGALVVQLVSRRRSAPEPLPVEMS